MKQEEIWKHINELFSNTAANINVLEEEIDLVVQRKYMNLASKLIGNAGEEKEVLQHARENVQRLFDKTTGDKEKKELLVLLAMIDDVVIYRAIESFAKQGGRLKKWATVALQQSRILIQSTLMDGSSFFVSTGLGGSGMNLRYCCVLLISDGIELKPYQRDIVREESKLAITRQGGSIEQCEFHDRYIILVLLLPILVDLNSTFEGIIKECNTYGECLSERMILTNVKKFSDKDIKDFIESEQASEPGNDAGPRAK
ncbi:MAG: hypothetical protein LBD64_02685 [Odoribacteraceae bacterium]|jgi:hypothetical protein|nr:hypothetical protein [Odoribacteraceae bacterium]